jgi:hypothetical protein
LDLSTPFTPDIQEKLENVLLKEEVDQIKSMGLPVTEGNIYLSQFAGLRGFRQLMKAPETATVKQVLGESVANSNPTYAETTIGELKKKFSENKTPTSKAKVTAPTQTSTAGTNLDKDSRPVSDMSSKSKVITVVQQTEYHYMGASPGNDMVLYNDTYDPKPELVTR